MTDTKYSVPARIARPEYRSPVDVGGLLMACSVLAVAIGVLVYSIMERIVP